MQTVRTVVIEVQPKSVDVLRKLITDFRAEEEAPSADFVARFQQEFGRPYQRYDRLKMAAPALHFMSMSVFQSAHYDPILVIEANFDGPAGPFWAQLEAAVPNLRAMLRCCKRAGPMGPVLDAIALDESSHPLAAYLEAHMVRPMIFHLGNRGLDRERILREGELFVAVRNELAAAELSPSNPYRPADPVTIHQRLRAKVQSAFPWLDEAAPPRIPMAEDAADKLRLLGFLFLVLFCLSIPGIFLALVTPPWVAVLVSLAAAIVVAWRIKDLRDLLPAVRRPMSMRAGGMLAVSVAVVLAIYLLVLSAVSAAIFAPLTPLNLWEAFKGSAWILFVALSSIPFSVFGVLLWLRRLERHDPSHDAPPVDEDLLREMMKREDRTVQNHMGSLVLVKPGVLRATLIRAGLFGLGLLLRLVARNGYLGDMRTIHFAHWALVSNESRLLFFSNFDGSWESYLDDFIEKAHAGLTLAWANGVGFPPARFLSQEGATHGRRFKAWARHSMTVSLFWFSAYRDYSVNQIERHARLADGLRERTLTPDKAKIWARDL